MANLNGKLLLSVLQILHGPATFREIVNRIADGAGISRHDVSHDIRESIQQTPNGGVLYGFIQRANRKYSFAHFPADVAAVAEINKQPTEAGAGSRARKDGYEKVDRNRNNQLEEKRKRKRGGKKKRAAARRRAAPRR